MALSANHLENSTRIPTLQEVPALPEPHATHRWNSNLRTRVFSSIALAGVLVLLGYGVNSAYHAFADSFVAPIILSPDNDLVIQNKLNLSRILAERTALVSKIEEDKAAVQADEKAIEQLTALQQTLGGALDWTVNVSGRQAAFGEADLTRLRQQERSVRQMIRHQEQTVANLKRDLEGGLVRRADVEREENSLQQLKMTLVQTQRDQSTAQLQLETASLTKKALSGPGMGRGRKVPSSPEVLSQREQSVRVDLELLKHESDRRMKLMQERVDKESLEKIDELVAQMKERPIFRAIESKQDVAFVPYTQIEGVTAGAQVYDCKLWGLFMCRKAGQVTELLPGEVVTQDPWGTVTRGQYAILSLSDGAAAKSKSLRIRGPGGDSSSQSESDRHAVKNEQPGARSQKVAGPAGKGG